MDIGISLPTVGPAGEREFVLEVAQAADSLEFHSVWVSDHVLLPKDRKSVYPYPESTTELAFNPGVGWLDPVASMGFLAGATEQIRIGTSVLVLPYRSPLVLAAEVATIDRLSEGRVILGVGAGWMDEEFDALAVPKRERGARTDEYLEVLRTLWAGGNASFEGRFVSFRDMELASAPHTSGGPPIWIGGNSPPALRRAGVLGDGWMGFEVFLDGVPSSRKIIEEAARGARRDPGAIVLSVRRGLLPPFEVSNFLPERRSVAGSPKQVAAEIRAYEDEGVSLMVFDLTMLVPEMVQTLEWLANEVRPLTS